MMARIYGQANRVIVYLGKAADDSDLALESIRIGAEGENFISDFVDYNMAGKSFLELLKRPWFQRIWVLQEVGLARSIHILCSSEEIDGYTFCLGISELKFFFEDSPHLQSLIRATIYMIRGSIFRPKHTLSPLRDLPLCELIDMYHGHKATIRHDKLYALLGMCSDNLSSTGLLPDYTISWKTLFKGLSSLSFVKRYP
ncbi:793e49d4-ccd2-4d74-b9fa-d4cb86995273 [Sclerotinia trifoliorum]|uniref:793e49d4-ccd2-4d74-b9fa-d4cb86995273 n=1 Tax=Sclerotinia trifoliorum TaxID=28548 RepID=A0A8H2VNQ3_9HELO|nr:793e49d4-ccd2-4d74-b9fa-d4cb86995273 [Sclerotinia trifoliorum]